MVPAYMLTVDISADCSTIGEEDFRASTASSLHHLSVLKGAFDRNPDTLTNRQVVVQKDDNNIDCYFVREVVLISVGRQRGEYLGQLYELIVHLIELELPNFHVQFEISQLNFS